MSAYAKLLRDLCTFERKSKNDNLKKVILSEQVSFILKFDIPPKFRDPGVLII